MARDTPLARETARRLDDTGVRVLDIEIFRLEPETDVPTYRAALLRGILRAVARDAPISAEIPMQALACTVPAVERARRILAKTRQLLETT
ncbi:MAG TPA: hypothetical protein VF059_10870 [Casimicrobiaceae bacterium]